MKNSILKVNMFGHSLGGYIAGHFTSKYPYIVDRLFLSSPGGLNLPPKGHLEKIKNILDNQNFIVKLFVNDIVSKTFEDKVIS